ncbi:ggdef family protein [Vibrio metoecus]|nr:ggdef family protein [Vibrio metoecus]PAR60108.1 ggdef family protein [Vibrio metoecus]
MLHFCWMFHTANLVSQKAASLLKSRFLCRKFGKCQRNLERCEFGSSLHSF